MKKRSWITGLSAVCLTAGILGFAAMPVRGAQIPNGVYVGEQSLGGMTPEEAKESVNQYVSGLAGQIITLDVDGEKVETTAEELGFYWSNPGAVEEVTDSFTEVNLLKQYMAIKDLEKESVKIPLITAVDREKVAAFVDEKCRAITGGAQDASITRENGQFVISPSVTGKAVDIEATKTALDEALAGGLENPISVTAVVTNQEPVITTEQLATITDVLGTFTTDFSSSGSSRSTNLRVGASKINGHLLMPGETLSGYECMQPFSTANGYATAAAYENGQVVDSIGGGVCQIATTLYNSALLAEVEIAQRQNHSMVVGYVKPSQDAAIAGTYKDIKFTNNYSTPIYVEGVTENKKLTFTIYGKESRPANRTIKFVSETLGTTDPGAPTLKVDNTMAPGSRKQVQSAHRGLRSRLWKYVYIDGAETERTILHTDSYIASKAIILVGPEAPVIVPPTEIPALPPETPAPAPQPVEGEYGGPGVNMDASVPAPAPAPPAPAETPAAVIPVEPGA